jgi:hypothetical protein
MVDDNFAPPSAMDSDQYFAPTLVLDDYIFMSPIQSHIFPQVTVRVSIKNLMIVDGTNDRQSRQWQLEF